MNNKICINCGHQNGSVANNCTNCGVALNQNDTPLPMPPKDAKTSRKVFWVLGIVGVLFVIGIGLLAIVGIGGYVYFQTKQEPIVEREYPVPPKKDQETPTDDSKDTAGDDESPLSDIQFPATTGEDELESENKGNSKITNAQLLLYFSKRKTNVGGFLLTNVKTTEGYINFPKRIAGVEAKYKKGSIRLTHNFAAYDSNSALADDFAAYKRKVKSSGGRITKQTETSVIYLKNKLVYFAFHNPQGGFHEISSRNGKDILKYHNDYFGVK